MTDIEHRGGVIDPETVEKNKNKLDLKPNVDFVSTQKNIFEKGYATILKREVTPEAQTWADQIDFIGIDNIISPQVNPNEAKELLARMPTALIELSKLKTISYHTFGRPRAIPVPGYHDDGNFDPSKARLIPYDQFPGASDHPTRILVGVSNGETIYPTPIPKTVSTDERAVYLYQVHVMLHEFFHTIDYPRRSEGAKDNIILETDGVQFTLQDWWDQFEELILSGKEPHCVSSYANTYIDDLNKETANKNIDIFTTAIAEQIAESFAAYELGIISNDDGWTDFQSASFGNIEQQKKFEQGQVPSANLKWELIDKLSRAKVIKQ